MKYPQAIGVNAQDEKREEICPKGDHKQIGCGECFHRSKMIITGRSVKGVSHAAF